LKVIHKLIPGKGKMEGMLGALDRRQGVGEEVLDVVSVGWVRSEEVLKMLSVELSRVLCKEKGVLVGFWLTVPNPGEGVVVEMKLFMNALGRASEVAATLVVELLPERSMANIRIRPILVRARRELDPLLVRLSAFKAWWENSARRLEYLTMVEGLGGGDNSCPISRYLCNQFVSMDICSYRWGEAGV